MSGPGTALATRSSMRRGETVETHALTEIVVGKDVLELVSSAMYVDPMTIYREYIQNAADSVDAARVAGLLSAEELGRVDIDVDASTRTVRIRDNGAAIPFAQFGRKLAALGGSAKRGSAARGFRGVGRLAGLGYAQEVVFRSRAPGEQKVSELRWDCRRLKTALRDGRDEYGVAELIREVTTLQCLSIDEPANRFFEVELRGIVRLRSDKLMSPAAIGEYLSQVAPVPFSPAFRFGGDLSQRLSKHIGAAPLDIRINGAAEPLYRPYRDTFSFDDKATISCTDISIAEIPGIDGGIAAVSWIAHHEYEGAIPAAALVKGLRLRAGNVQVGDHALLEELFPEPRFNGWSMGEVHVLDRRIIPNGRRDHFEQNAHFHNLLNHLTLSARDIARRCRTSSVRRKWEREFELQVQVAEQSLAIIAQGGTGREARQRQAERAQQALTKAANVAAKPLLSEGSDDKVARMAEMRQRLHDVMGEALAQSPLLRLPKAKRIAYERFFELVYDCSSNRVAAKALIDRILFKITESQDAASRSGSGSR